MSYDVDLAAEITRLRGLLERAEGRESNLNADLAAANNRALVWEGRAVAAEAKLPPWIQAFAQVHACVLPAAVVDADHPAAMAQEASKAVLALVETLETLMDLQNGPPLLTEQEAWSKTMLRAQMLLNARKGTP